MKKVVQFLKGGLLGVLLLLAIAMIASIMLLVFGIELDVNNIFVIIYNNGSNASVKFKDIPTIIAFVIGGIVWLKKYNKKIESTESNETKNEEM